MSPPAWSDRNFYRDRNLGHVRVINQVFSHGSTTDRTLSDQPRTETSRLQVSCTDLLSHLKGYCVHAAIKTGRVSPCFRSAWINKVSLNVLNCLSAADLTQWCGQTSLPYIGCLGELGQTGYSFGFTTYPLSSCVLSNLRLAWNCNTASLIRYALYFNIR